jgi:hypothetical protein
MGVERCEIPKPLIHHQMTHTINSRNSLPAVFVFERIVFISKLASNFI